MIARLKRTGEWVDVYKNGSVISKNGTEGCYYKFGDTTKNVIYGSELVFEKDNEGKALLYAVEKTAKRTKREVIEKAVKWLEEEMCYRDQSSGRGHWGEIKTLGTYDSLEEFIKEFKQAMED